MGRLTAGRAAKAVSMAGVQNLTMRSRVDLELASSRARNDLEEARLHFRVKIVSLEIDIDEFDV